MSAVPGPAPAPAPTATTTTGNVPPSGTGTSGPASSTSGVAGASRVGAIDNTVPWVGGSAAMKAARKSPLGPLCYRPTDFKSKMKQYELLTNRSGVDESRRLEIDNKSAGERRTNVVPWIDELKIEAETKGFDTVFRIAPTVMPLPKTIDEEIYLLEQWGMLEQKDVKAFVVLLTDPYDVENLRLSAKMIRNSLGPELYSRVASLAGPTATGPELFKIAVDQVMHMPNAQLQQLTDMRLQDIPGENVGILGEKITEVVREIEGSGSAPTDLLKLVSRPYTRASDKRFRQNANSYHANIRNGTYAKPWQQFVAEMHLYYQDLVQMKDYTPAL